MSWTRRALRQPARFTPDFTRSTCTSPRTCAHPGSALRLAQSGAPCAPFSQTPKRKGRKKEKNCLRWKQWSGSKCPWYMFRGWSTQEWRSPSRLRRTLWLSCCRSTAREMEMIHRYQHHQHHHPRRVPQPRRTSSITAATRCSPTLKPSTCSTSGTRRWLKPWATSSSWAG